MSSQPLPLGRARPSEAITFGLPGHARRRRRREFWATLLLATALVSAVWHVGQMRPDGVVTGAPIREAGGGEAPSGPHVGTAGLTRALAGAVERARSRAASEGIALDIVSGYRDSATQQGLFEEAVARYGSVEAASRWVLPPEASKHVTGEAVDVGPPRAAAWLDRQGSAYGLCRRYDNEPWHFELLTKPGKPCPPREPNPQP